MKKHFSSALKVSLMVLMVSILVCGCASFSEEPKLKKIPSVYTGTQDAKLNPNTFWPDSKLRESFYRYWSLRYTRDMTKLSFAMEAPYFQEMVDEQRYTVYIGGAWQVEPLEIRFQKITKETDNLYSFVFGLKLKLQNGEVQEISFIDQWVKVRGEWYHIFKDMLIFPAVS